MRPCDEEKRARADRAAGTIVLVGLLEIGNNNNGAWEFLIVSVRWGCIRRSSKRFLSSTPDLVTWDWATSHSCSFVRLLFRLCRTQKTRSLLEEDNRDSPVNLKSRNPLWDDLRKCTVASRGSDLSPLPVIPAPV